MGKKSNRSDDRKGKTFRVVWRDADGQVKKGGLVYESITVAQEAAEEMNKLSRGTNHWVEEVKAEEGKPPFRWINPGKRWSR